MYRKSIVNFKFWTESVPTSSERRRWKWEERGYEDRGRRRKRVRITSAWWQPWYEAALTKAGGVVPTHTWLAEFSIWVLENGRAKLLECPWRQQYPQISTVSLEVASCWVSLTLRWREMNAEAKMMEVGESAGTPDLGLHHSSPCKRTRTQFEPNWNITWLHIRRPCPIKEKKKQSHSKEEHVLYTYLHSPTQWLFSGQRTRNSI